MRCLNRDVIKYIAMFTMLLNHVAVVFLPENTVLYEVLVDIGYFTAITMCYFLVEGYSYTRLKKEYGKRLLIFAVISEIPFCLAFAEEGILEFSGLNMMFTLFICFLILWVMEHETNPSYRNMEIMGLLCCSTLCDWAVFAPVFTILFAWAEDSREKKGKAFLTAAAIFGIFNFTAGIETVSIGRNILSSLGTMMGIVVSGIVILYFYNGKRMKRGQVFSKYFFYWFYPVHLLILGILRIAAG